MKPFYSAITAGLIGILLNTGNADARQNQDHAANFQINNPLAQNVPADLEQKLDAAEGYFQKALETNNPSNEINHLQSSQNEYESIYLEFIKDAKNLKPEPHSRFWLGISKLMVRIDKLAEGETYLKESIRIKPDVAEAYHYLATCQAFQGKLQEAIPNYETAIKLNYDQHWKSQSGLAYVKFRIGQKEEGLEIIQKVIQSKPEYPLAHAIRSDMLNNIGKTEEAQKEAQIYQELKNKPSE